MKKFCEVLLQIFIAMIKTFLKVMFGLIFLGFLGAFNDSRRG